MRALGRIPAQSSHSSDSIDVVEGPFHPDQLVRHWGRAPLLIRGAFEERLLNDTAVFPAWDVLLAMASYQEDDGRPLGDSARLVHHDPSRPESFQLEWGPLELDDDGRNPRMVVDFDGRATADPASASIRTWTVVLNDVDRHFPQLADWLDETFGAFLPRWRRDDAQVSLAPPGGGIGRHVDNYDVFLVQTRGRRRWTVGLDRLSMQQELKSLIPDLDVRILSLDYDAKTLDLDPGDVLYIPPRFPHEGVSLSDACQTLSVGCRAPSAAELVARVAEELVASSRLPAHARYAENPIESLSLPSSLRPTHRDGATTLTPRVKEELKALVRRAVDDLLDDEAGWDELVGKAVTEALRYTSDEVLDAPSVHEQHGAPSSWRRRPGVSLATSHLTDGTVRLYCHGELWETRDAAALPLVARLELGRSVRRQEVEQLSPAGQDFWHDLVSSGVVIPQEGE